MNVYWNRASADNHSSITGIESLQKSAFRDLAVKARFILSSNDHKSQASSNPEKCCRNIHTSAPFKRLGLHNKDKMWIYNKYRAAAALLIFFMAFNCFRGLAAKGGSALILFS